MGLASADGETVLNPQWRQHQHEGARNQLAAHQIARMLARIHALSWNPGGGIAIGLMWAQINNLQQQFGSGWSGPGNHSVGQASAASNRPDSSGYAPGEPYKAERYVYNHWSFPQNGEFVDLTDFKIQIFDKNGPLAGIEVIASAQDYGVRGAFGSMSSAPGKNCFAAGRRLLF